MTEQRDPSSLPEDIYQLLEQVDETGHAVSEDNVEWAGEIFKDLLRKRLTKQEQLVGEEVLRFSTIGKKDRQLWYMANMPEKAEKLSGKTKLKFLLGDLWEVILLFLAKESGHSVEHTQLEVEEDGVSGHIDAIIDGVLVDVKSASPYSYEKFKSGGYLFDDPFGYIPQLSGYAIKVGTPRAGWLVGNKVDGSIQYVELSKEDIEANPPSDRIRSLREIIGKDAPPPRCYDDVAEGKSGNRKLGVGCSYCAFKDDCWADANSGKGLRKFFYSRGPVWLTVVKREPLVAEAD